MALQIPPIIKKHPVATVGIIVGGVILLALVMNASGGAASSGAAAASGPTDAQVASATQLQLAQLSVSSQSSLAAQQITADQQKFAYQADLAKYQGDQDYALQNKSLDLTAAYQTLQTQAQAALASQTFSYQLASQQSAESASFNQLKLQTDANMHSADTQAATTLGLSAISADVQKTLADYSKQLGLAQTQAQVSINSNNNKTSTKNNLINTVGSIFKSFF